MYSKAKNQCKLILCSFIYVTRYTSVRVITFAHVFFFISFKHMCVVGEYVSNTIFFVYILGSSICLDLPLNVSGPLYEVC